MFSIASLSAFSGSGISPVHPTQVRAQGSAPQVASPPVPPGPLLGKGDSGVEPTRTLPRGSLLDLSV
jgi:hypothetical protein